MALSHYMKPGVSQIGRVKILTCDPATRRIEGGYKGNLIQIAVWDVSSAFRWPKEGEWWTVQCESGIWKLRSRTQDGEISGSGLEVEMQPEAMPIEQMAPGEMKLDSNLIVDASGRTFVAVDLTGIADGDTLRWNSTLKRFVAGP